MVNNKEVLEYHSVVDFLTKASITPLDVREIKGLGFDSKWPPLAGQNEREWNQTFVTLGLKFGLGWTVSRISRKQPRSQASVNVGIQKGIAKIHKYSEGDVQEAFPLDSLKHPSPRQLFVKVVAGNTDSPSRPDLLDPDQYTRMNDFVRELGIVRPNVEVALRLMRGFIRRSPVEVFRLGMSNYFPTHKKSEMEAFLSEYIAWK